MVKGRPLTQLVARGAWGTVECIVLPSGDVPVVEFFDEFDDALAPFAVLFQQMADYGRVSPKRFKKEMGKLFAFKYEVGNRPVRFPCFQDGKRWILTHGFIKPGAQKGKGKWPPSEVERAERGMADYWARKRQAESAKGKR